MKASTMTHDYVEKARAAAIEAHDGQKYNLRGARVEYFNHLQWVADEVEVFGPEYVVVAYLHDIVEDTDWTVDRVGEEFGWVIAGAVNLLTRDKDGGEEYPEYVERIAKSGRELAIRVKIADLFVNITNGLGDDAWDDNVKKYVVSMNRLTKAL